MEDFHYTSINPDEEFNRERLKEAGALVGGLEVSLKKLNENSTDPDSIKTLGNVLYSDQSYFLTQPNGELMAKTGAEMALKPGKSNLEAYVKNNVRDVFSILSVEEKLKLINSSELNTLEETAENEAYNKFAKLSKESKTIAETLQDPNKKVQYLQEKIGLSPEWAQEMFKLYSGSNVYLDRMLNEYAHQNSVEKGKLISNEDGSPNEAIIESFANKSLQYAMAHEEGNDDYVSNLSTLAINKLNEAK